MVSNFEASIMRQLSEIDNKENPLEAKLKAAESLVAILKKDKAATLWFKDNSTYYVKMVEKLKSFVDYLKTIIVRRRHLMSLMEKRQKVERKLWKFENRPLSPGEITEIEKIHQEQIKNLQGVDINEFVVHTNLLISVFENLKGFADSLSKQL